MAGVWRPVIAAGGARLWSLGVSVLILAVSARALGEVGRGEFASVFTLALLASSVLYLSLGQVGLHDARDLGSEPTWRGRLLSTLAVFTVAVSILAWLGVAALWLITDGDAFKPLGPGLLSVGLLLLPVLVWEQFGSALLAMHDRVDIYNRAQIVGRSISLVAAIILLTLGTGVYGLLLSVLAGQAFVALRGIAFLSRASPRARPSRSYASHLVRRGLRLHLSAVATVLIASADVLIVAHQLGARAAGSYQLATQLLLALTVVPQAATLIVYGRVVSEGAQPAWEQQRRIGAAALALVVVLSTIAWIAAPTLIDIVAGAGFDDSVGVFRIVVIAALGFSLSAIMAPQWIGRGLFGLASGLTVAVATLNVTANLIVVPRAGLHGAAFVVVGTSAAMLVINGALAIRCERERSPAVRRAPPASTRPHESPEAGA